MKNPTVKQLIQKLQDCDQNAVVCLYHPNQNPESKFVSVVMVEDIGEQIYLDDDDNTKFGSVVSVF
jgi:hypothetical protein